MQKTIYDFTIPSIDGGIIDLAQYRGKKILLVNTASECGYTYQYAHLQELFDNYNHSLVVIGLPANDFGGQEPGTHDEIAEFCALRYGVTFPLSEKLSVTQNPHPLITFLQQQHSGDNAPTQITWNFFKFLFDADGNFVAAFHSGVEPLDETFLQFIEQQ